MDGFPKTSKKLAKSNGIKLRRTRKGHSKRSALRWGEPHGFDDVARVLYHKRPMTAQRVGFENTCKRMFNNIQRSGWQF
jgi:hypothetical protein